MERRCENCEFWQAKHNKGECRKYAPKEIMSSSVDGTEYSNDWAVTASDEWCGEFKEKEQK